MRAAPPVSVKGSGGWAWRAAQALASALAAAALAAWGLGWAEQAVWPALPLGLLIGGVAWRLEVPTCQELRWDGQDWRLDGTAGRLAVAVDLSAFLLIRLRPLGTRRYRWCAITAAEAGVAWPALRAALYSRPPETTPRGRPPERAAD